MTWFILAQAAIPDVGFWTAIGNLSGSALVGALLVYLIVYYQPRMQDKFHEHSDKQFDRYEKTLDKVCDTFTKSSSEQSERFTTATDRILTKVDGIRCKAQ